MVSAVEEKEAVAAIDWDGNLHGYRPGPTWHEDVAAKLDLHVELDQELDPVDYEIIRHRLWTINMAHGETVTRISGSPVFASLDFNMSILTEDAEYVMNAPFVQFLNAGAANGIRYLMEHFGESPGIDEGDIYVCNDPWIGAVHEMDVLFACPVFVGGQIFCWVANAGHQYDLGGIVPGGWPQNAVDVYSDPTIFTPFKLVEGGELRRDLERMYLRQSRMPQLVALDLRAQISGCRYAGGEIAKLCEEFGAGTVKAAMRRILDNAQASIQRKLERIPDGTWSEARYLDERLPEDPHSHRVQVNITKRGDRLIIDNEGSEAQGEGPIGITPVAFAGAVLATLSTSMMSEHLFAIGGAERQIDYRLQPGLLNCVDHPAAVGAGVLNAPNAIAAIQTCVNRMLACDPELKRDIVAPAPDYHAPIIIGHNDEGAFYGSAILDHFAMGSGARSFKDGIDTGGPLWSPLTFLLNVEAVEEWYPLIFLYRAEQIDGGGAGRWRGGTGLNYCWTPYRAQSMDMVTLGGGMSVSSHGSEGVFGGYPSPSARTTVTKETDLLERFARGVVPASILDLEAGDVRSLAQKTNGTPLGEGDVCEMICVGGGGYGDPLDREPERVAADVAAGYVSQGVAAEVYGVVLGADGEAITDETVTRRQGLREERATWPRAAEAFHVAEPDDEWPEATGEPPLAIHEVLRVVDRDGSRVISCTRCDQLLGGATGDFKRHLQVDRSLDPVPGAVNKPGEFTEDEIEFRRYCCPGCQTLVVAEIARARDLPIADVRLVGA